MAQGGAEQEVIDPQTRIAGEGIPKILPECIDALIRMEKPDRVRPALSHEVGVCSSDLRTKQRVVQPPLRLVDVELGRHDVEIANQRYRHVQFQQFIRVGMQAFEPTDLVVELRAGRWISVGKIKTAHNDAVDRSLNIAAVTVVRVAGKPPTGFVRLLIAGEDGHAIP